MQRSEEVRSPLGTRAGSTLYDKLNLLSAEISEGIVNLSRGKRWLVESELRRLRDEADGQTSPEAVYSILLFRKYAGIANQIQERSEELESQVQNQAAQAGSYLDVGNGTIDGVGEAKLVGFEALKSNLFWLRVLAAMFSFISFVVMSTVPGITHTNFNPAQRGYHYGCLEVEHGGFNMRPYQFVIVSGVMIYIQTLVTSIYYVLPVDENNEKYMPGLRSCVGCLLNDDNHETEVMSSLGACARMFSRVLECVVDFCLVAMGAVAFIIAAIAVDQPARFHGHGYGQFVYYYNIASYYETYSHRADSCVDDEDVVGEIRASLAMLFFALVVMFLCLQVSWRAAKQEFTHRTPPTGHTASDIGSRGVHTFEGREAFLAQPLPTAEDEEEGGAGGAGTGGGHSSDEEVAVEFHRTPPRRTPPPQQEREEPKSARANRGAMYMRNHEPQRFAAHSVPQRNPVSESESEEKTGRDRSLGHVVAAVEPAEHQEVEVWEETDL